MSGEIASKIGHPLSLPISVVMNRTQMEGGDVLAYAVPIDSSGEQTGAPAGCEIHINPSLYHQRDTADANITYAHELFHCFEFMDFPTIAAFGAAPKWLKEGEAEWVGNTLVPPSDRIDSFSFWNRYLLDIGIPLFDRSYDAIGFFSLMTESGEDTWHLLDPMLRAGSSADAYSLAANTTLRRDWASSLARQPELGSGWNATGPGITQYKYAPETNVLRKGTVLTKTVAPYTNALIKFSPATDVVTITTNTFNSRLHEAGGRNIDGLSGSTNYCVNECNKCTEMQMMDKLPPGTTWLAVTGDVMGATYTVSGGPAMCTCLVGTWKVTDESSEFLGISGGGAGATWIIDPNGMISVNYDGSTPVNFRGHAITYSGVQTITLNPSTFTGDASGQWLIDSEAGTATAVNGGTTSPVGAGGPAHGTWTCSGNMMSVSVDAAAGGTITDTFVRSGT